MIGTTGPEIRRSTVATTVGEQRVRPRNADKAVGVTFYFLGSLAMRLRRDGCVLNLASGTTLRAALSSVSQGAKSFGVELDGAKMKAFVNGKPGALDAELPDGAEVLLVPSAVLFDRPERVQEGSERRRISGLHQYSTFS